MRVVTSVSGSIVMRVSGDEVIPDRAIRPQDLLGFLERTYGLTRSQIAPNNQPPFLLQDGQLKIGEELLAVMQIAIYPNGDVITAQNTDVAEVLLKDYTTQLDVELGFKFGAAKKTLSYLSNIVVQFDEAIDGPLSILGELDTIIGDAIQTQEGPIKFKRLAFGRGDPIPGQVFPMTLDMLDKVDFLIERRTNEPYSENKFFCSAPLSSSEHVKVLEQIEKVLLKGR